MNRPPDIEELLAGVDDPAERERLRRVHQLLLETEPPPELSSALQTPPPARGATFFPQRLLRPRTVLVGAALLGAFFVGLLAGAPSSDQGPAAGIQIDRTIQLEGEGNDTGAIGIGVRDGKGNLPMVVSVWGLEHLTDGDYYTLALTREGKPVVTCGTFNVSGRQTTVRMLAAYNLEGFDGWVVLHYDSTTHDDTPVLWTKRA